MNKHDHANWKRPLVLLISRKLQTNYRQEENLQCLLRIVCLHFYTYLEGGVTVNQMLVNQTGHLYPAVKHSPPAKNEVTGNRCAPIREA